MPSRRPIRAVLFDAGNTLIRMNYPVIARELARHGIQVDTETLERAEWRARVRLDADVLSRFTPGTAEASTEDQSVAGRYLRYVLEEVGVTDAGAITAMADWRRAYNVPVGLWNATEPCAEDALRLARRAGLAAAVISNSNGSVRSILVELGLTRWLDFVIDSGEVGVEKPDPRIFRLALERTGVDADEAIYIGDLYSIDVVGARSAGITPILLDPGACWGERDCLSAENALAAVRRVVNGGLPRTS